jgi:hypothetical protein
MEQKVAPLVIAADAACRLRGGSFVMGDGQRFAPGVHWNFVLDGVLILVVVSLAVALVLLLI